MLQKAREFYGRYERPISSLSLIGGFIFDAIVLRRVDQFSDNLWVLIHIFIVGAAMIWVHTLTEGNEADPQSLKFWLVNIIQFFFGGLLSIFLVFYFRTGDLATSWPFLLLLALVFWANESLKRQYVRLSFQVALFYLSLFAIATYLVPVVIHRIGDPIFILSSITATLVIILFLWIIKKTSPEKFKRSRNLMYVLIISIFIGMNVLYFTNIIPPLPLSLQDGGVYHTLAVRGPGSYAVTYENNGFFSFLHLYEPVHVPPDSNTLYVYSAVFSPAGLNTTIVHQWQYYDVSGETWVTTENVSLPVIGGASGGFHTYSEGQNLAPGLWRVNVLAVSGQIIDRIRFRVYYASTSPVLYSKVL